MVNPFIVKRSKEISMTKDIKKSRGEAMSELNNGKNIINENDLEKVVGGTSAMHTGGLQRYYFKCINPACSQFNHKVAVMLPRTDVKVKCKLCNHVMKLQV